MWACGKLVGNSIDGYVVEKREAVDGPRGPWVPEKVNISACCKMEVKLEEAKNYEFRLRAVNNEGQGKPSNAIDVESLKAKTGNLKGNRVEMGPSKFNIIYDPKVCQPANICGPIKIAIP